MQSQWLTIGCRPDGCARKALRVSATAQRPALAMMEPEGADGTSRAWVLLATDDRNDAEAVRKLLVGTVDSIAFSKSPDDAATDFSKHKPKIVLLAFDTIEKAKTYCLGLYRGAACTRDVPHRTLLLCRKEEVNAAFELCRKAYYDDYVLFWPLTHDGNRLKMSVLLALRHLESSSSIALAARLAAQARRIASLESLLSTAKDEFGNHLCGIETSLQAAGQRLAAVPDQTRDDDVRDVIRTLDGHSRSLREWAGALAGKLQPQVSAVRELQTLARSVKRRILVVDADESAAPALRSLLAELDCDIEWVVHGRAACMALQRRSPDLVLLDIELPDIHGQETLRKLRESGLTRQLP
ncbi:MAG: response regulator, partial [Lautropia sp.]